MTDREVLAAVDHTLLAPAATWQQIRETCDDALQYGAATVCLPPCYVRQAAEYLAGRLPVCTVIGFPNGYQTTQVKCFEARQAVGDGAEEIDMVIRLGWVKERNWPALEEEIRQVKAACGGKTLKVIVETCLLTPEEKALLCGVVSRGGGDYIKTSTGFSASGATEEDVALLAEHRPAGLKIKAAGGIKSMETARRFLALGADRLGTSRLIQLAKAKV